MTLDSLLAEPLPEANGDPHQLHYVAATGWTPAEYHRPAWAPMPEPPMTIHACPRCKRPAKWFQLGSDKTYNSFQTYCKNHCEPDYKYLWVDRAMLELDVPPAYVRGMTFDQFIISGKPDTMQLQERALAESLRFARTLGRWLALSGGTGTGKSHLAVSALRLALTNFADKAEWEYSDIEKYRPLRLPTGIIGRVPLIRFMRGSELFADLQVGFRANRRDIAAGIVAPDLLIVDDFDADYNKGESKILESVLDARYTTPRSTLFTTNLTRTEFFEAIGKRSASRFQQIGEFVNMESNDQRRGKPAPDPDDGLKVTSEWSEQ